MDIPLSFCCPTPTKNVLLPQIVYFLDKNAGLFIRQKPKNQVLMRKRTLHIFLLFLTALLFARPAQSQPTSRPLAPGDKADALTALLHAGRTVSHTGPLGTLHARSGHFRRSSPRL